MSQLRLTNTRWGTRNLNVVAFSSPITGMIESAQTRTLEHHFPFKALQPELELEVVFRSEREYEDFQIWVRNVQLDSQTNAISPGVTVWWPQRSIYNWTGLIKAFRAGGERHNYVPRAKFTIDLVDSLVSARTTLPSLGSNFEEIYGINTPGGVLGSPSAWDTLLTAPPPVTPEAPSTEPSGIGGVGGG